MVSRLFFAFVTSSNYLVRDSKSEEGPDVDWVDGRAFGCSGSRDLDVALGVLFKVIVIESFDLWALSRVQFSWKAVELSGSTVKGIRKENGEGSITCRRNWASSSSSWWIVVLSLRRSRFSILRSTKNWATWCWTAWKYWNCFMLASGMVWIKGLVYSSACSEVFLSWSTWVVSRWSRSGTVGLLESAEGLGNFAGTIGSVIFWEVDASISTNNSGRYIENNREQFFGLKKGACRFSVIRRAVIQLLSGVPQVFVMIKQ